MINSTNHHPDENMLIEFSAGTLETAASICVSAHLTLLLQLSSTSCLRLDQVGSQIMSQSEPMDVADECL